MEKAKEILFSIYTLPVFKTTLKTAAEIAKLPGTKDFVEKWMDTMGKLVFWSGKGKTLETPAELAQQWQEHMPKPYSNFPIVETTKDYAIAEIHLHCPLRGTGNHQACHHLMQFDRTLVEEAGGKFTVLSSQSNNGKGFCTVKLEKG